jgi:alanyl-tRNA synthetase
MMPAMPQQDGTTVVSFPGGALTGTATVTRVVAVDDRFGVVCDATPFHPVDHTWPDQPGDQGVITADGYRAAVVDCVIGAAPAGGAEGGMRLGVDIPVRRGDTGWTWYAVHVVADDPRSALGRPVQLQVDAALRRGLSAGHTACELVGPALNDALRDRWTKDAKPDALGAPDFDKLAIASSRIYPYGSVDHYRIGKSLRRKGFSPEGLAESLASVAARVNALLAGWVAEDVPVTVRTDGPTLADLRYFSCRVNQGEIAAPCGGTHVATTGELGRVSADLSLSDDGSELRLTTTVEKVGTA